MLDSKTVNLAGERIKLEIEDQMKHLKEDIERCKTAMESQGIFHSGMTIKNFQIYVPTQ